MVEKIVIDRQIESIRAILNGNSSNKSKPSLEPLPFQGPTKKRLTSPKSRKTKKKKYIKTKPLKRNNRKKKKKKRWSKRPFLIPNDKGEIYNF